MAQAVPRRLAVLFGLLLAGSLLAPPATVHANWPDDPAINVPLCTAADDQAHVAGCADGEGGAIVCWRDDRTDTGNIYAQRVGASGRVLWGTNGIGVCTATGQQYAPAIVSDGAGGAFIAWIDGRSGSDDIYVQHVGAAGKNTWTDNGVALCTAANLQRYPSMVADGQGGTIVAWQDLRSGTNWDVYAQKVGANGAVQWAANGLAGCTAADAQAEVGGGSDVVGGAFVVWRDQRTGNLDAYAQRIYANGTAAWTANGVALCTSGLVMGEVAVISDGAEGAIAAWSDYRSGDYDLYAQRVNGVGVVQWATNGLGVCTEPGAQGSPVLTSNASGGAYVAWLDTRNGGQDLYYQYVHAYGSLGWTPLGVDVCTGNGLRYNPRAISDGDAGVILVWDDTRSGVTDLYAQRLPYGTDIGDWAAKGAAVCTSGDVETALFAAVVDGAGGAICAWSDHRGGDTDIFAQRIDQWGYLGAQPAIASVKDVANDQGGQVKVSWYASPLDSFPDYAIATYHVYRSVPASLVAQARRSGIAITSADEAGRPARPGALLARTVGTAATFWEYLADVPARHLPGYSYLAATESDSMAGSNPRTLFMVEARDATGSMWWFSDPDSGYSVDDLAPDMPAPFAGQYVGGTTTMNWGECTAADFAAFRLYRGHGADFVPSSETLLATTASTGYVDPAGAPFYYKLCALDIHGNASPFATLLPAGTVGVPGLGIPAELALSAPAPNPLRGSCAMRLALPRAAEVSLAVFDQQGRRVRVLLAGAQPAGEHAVTWDGRDDGGKLAPSGIYFVRAAVEDRTFTHRIAALR